MKRWLVFAVAAIAIAGFTTVSFAAGIAGSHHDMGAWYGNDPNYDACYACHGIKETAAGTAALGQVGSLCWNRCHTSGATAGDLARLTTTAVAELGHIDNSTASYAMVQNVTPTDNESSGGITKYTSGHLFIAGIENLPAPDASASAPAWPYIGTGVSMQCTSCHDVHSNAYTPFLRAPLADNVTVANAFCHRCHGATTDGAARYVAITATPNGSHPSEVNYTGAAGRSDAFGRRGRSIVFKDTIAADNDAIFRNVSPWGTALNAPSAMYNPGGKLGVPQGVNTYNDVANGGTIVGCYTCHATHATNTTQLLVANYRPSGLTREQSDLCVGCHGGNGSFGNSVNNPANPGTTAYFHPVDQDSRPASLPWSGMDNTQWQVTTGTFNITVNLDNGANDAPVSTGLSRLLCASCHTRGSIAASAAGVHAGPAGTMLLNPNKPTCESCHNTTALVAGLAANSHHVYGGGAARGASYPTWGYGLPTANSGNIEYNGTFTANLNDGLQCNDCHVFNGTAHNWN